MSIDQLLFKAGVTFGFFGMFRSCTFQKLSMIALVADSWMEYTLNKGIIPTISFLWPILITGFYFLFAAKFNSQACAYYCRRDDLSEPWATLCPLKILMT